MCHVCVYTRSVVLPDVAAVLFYSVPDERKGQQWVDQVCSDARVTTTHVDIVTGVAHLYAIYACVSSLKQKLLDLSSANLAGG